MGIVEGVLFNQGAGAAVHTDLAQHAHLVANSGRQQEICAVKIWRERSGLDFPSLYLELTAMHVLAAARFGQLADKCAHGAVLPLDPVPAGRGLRSGER